MKPPSRSRTGWLFEPVSNASLALYRILFGVTACAVAGASAWAEVSGWAFTISGHDGLTLSALALVMGGGVGVALGGGYRVSALALTGGSLAAVVMLGEPVPGPFSALGLLSAILLVVPAHRRWSVDVALRPRQGGHDLPRWGVLLVQTQSAVVCGMAALQVLPGAAPDAVLAWAGWGGSALGAPPWAPLAMAGGGLALGAVAGPTVLRRRVRGLLLFLVAALHLAAAVFAPTLFIAVLMTASASLFLPPDWPMRAVGRPESGWVRASRHTGGLTPLRCAGVAFAALYFSLQLAAAVGPRVSMEADREPSLLHVHAHP